MIIVFNHSNFNKNFQDEATEIPAGLITEAAQLTNG